jgi:hypothetical protein
MKLVKYPARTIIMKMFCDCGKGEFVVHASTKEGFIHRCTNKECGAEVVLAQQFPTTAAEIVNIVVEDLNEKKEESNTLEIAEGKEE